MKRAHAFFFVLPSVLAVLISATPGARAADPPAATQPAPNVAERPRALVLPFDPLDRQPTSVWIGLAIQQSLASDLSQMAKVQPVIPAAQPPATAPAATAAAAPGIINAAGATEEQFGHWAGEVYTALTTHYGLTPEQAVYFSLHEEADTREHEGGVMGHGSFRRLVLQRLLEEGAEVRPGYTLEYCALTSIDLHGAILEAALNAAARK